MKKQLLTNLILLIALALPANAQMDAPGSSPTLITEKKPVASLSITEKRPVVSPSAAADQDQCLFFDDALLASVRVDPRIESAKAERDLAAANFQAALSQSLPQVSTFAQFGLSSNGLLQNNQSDNEFGLTVQQGLYNFGATRLSQVGAKAQMSATEHNISQVKADVAQEIGTAYLELLRTNDILALAKKQEDYFAKDALSVDARLRQQAITITDASKIKADLALAQSQTIDATLSRDQAKSRLEILLDEEINCTAKNNLMAFFQEARAQVNAESLDSLLDLATSNAAALRESQERIRAARASTEEVRRAGLPTVNLTGFISYQEATANPFLGQTGGGLDERSRIGLNISGPLFTGGLNLARQRDARARLRGANSDLVAIRAALKDTITRAWVRAKGQENSQAALAKATKNLKTQLDNIQQEYDLGTRTLTEVVNVAEAYFQTASQEVNMRYQYYNNLFILYSSAYGLDIPNGGR